MYTLKKQQFKYVAKTDKKLYTVAEKPRDALYRLTIFVPPPGQTGRWRHHAVNLSVRLSVRPSVTKLVNTML